MLRRVGSPLLPVLVFLVLGLRELGLPGLYMDAVNPDYLGVWVRQPAGEMPAWIYPDNALAPGYELPLLNSLYGGATTAYLAAAAFELFGSGIGTVRLLHVAYGVGLLLLVYRLVEAASGSRVAASVATVLLAVDPSFVYAWRTQYYLQLFPNLFLFGATLLALGLSGRAGRSRRLALAGIGAFAGFAAYGYFVYAMYAVVLLVVVVRRLPAGTRLGGLRDYSAGFAVGWLPYVFAHLSIVVQGGTGFWWQSIAGLQDAYGVADDVGTGLGSKLTYTVSRLATVAGGDQVAGVVLARDAATEAAGIAVLALAVSAVAAGLVLLRRPSHAPVDDVAGATGSALSLELVAGLLVAQLAFGALLGRPLEPQHYVAVLPWLYVGAGVGGWAICSAWARTGDLVRWPVRAAGVLAGLLGLLLVTGTLALHAELVRTGGRGWYSDAVNRVGVELQNLPQDSVAVFPQWGFWMGAAIIEGGDTVLWHEADVSTVPARIAREPRAPFYAVVLTPAQAEAGAVAALTRETGMGLYEQRDVLDRQGRIAARIAVLRAPGAVDPRWGPTAVAPG